MPKTGRYNWGDIIYKGLKELGGEAHLDDIYKVVSKYPEAAEKLELAKSRTPGKVVDFEAQIRVLLSARDPRFERMPEKRGWWKIRTTPLPPMPTTIPSMLDPNIVAPRNYSLPARYRERSLAVLKFMCDYKRGEGYTQKEIAKALEIDINAVNKIINFMKMEGLLQIVGGKGKTHNPFRYAPLPGVLEERIINPIMERKEKEAFGGVRS